MKHFTLCIFLLLSLTTLSFSEQPYISVTAESEIQLEPQYAKISGTLKVTDPAMENSYSHLIQTIKKLNQLLLPTGISAKELEKSNVRQGVTQEWKKREQIITGYFSSVSINITVSNLTDLQKIYKALSQIKEFSIHTTQYKRRDMEEQQMQQTELALKKAKTKATRMAQSISTTIGDPIRISESSAQQPHPMARNLAMHADGLPPQEDLSGYLIIQSKVMVDFLLK